MASWNFLKILGLASFFLASSCVVSEKNSRSTKKKENTTDVVEKGTTPIPTPFQTPQATIPPWPTVTATATATATATPMSTMTATPVATVTPTPTPTPVGTVVPLISGSFPVEAKQGLPFEFSPISLGEGVNIQGENLPSWASLNGQTGKVTGVPFEKTLYQGIVISASKGSQKTSMGPFTLDILGDSLFSSQWHLNNRGQSSFSKSGGVGGMDLDLSEVWGQGLTGKNQTIFLSDDGLDVSHQDLVGNLFSGFHKDYDLSSPYYGNPQPRYLEGSHGTSVAGLIAARGFNDVGVRGVAPLASLAGSNFVGGDSSLEHYIDQATGSYHIFNYSYGISFVPGNIPWETLYPTQVHNQFIKGRNGKGSVFVKSAGNSFYECDFFSNDFYQISSNGYICLPHNSNLDPDNAISDMIVVAALNAKGQRASYSSTGSNLWISAFGGEFGDDEPAIVTTDHSGCSVGYSRSGVEGTLFEKGEEEKNEDCDYTHTFNGTSAAVPMVSGVVALLLEANPNLKAREVKYVLAKTASLVNDSQFSNKHPFNGGFFDLSGHQYEQGWVTNSAGFSFHNHFGFGRINPKDALSLAKNLHLNWGEQVQLNPQFVSTTYTKNPNNSIPDHSATGITSSMTVSQNIIIEGVQIQIEVTHGRPGDLGIELTSPSGTKSILLNINNALLIPYDNEGKPFWVANFDDFVLSTNAFYGETSQGNWSLKVIDGLEGDTGTQYDLASNQKGTLKRWSLNIIGH